MKRRGLRELYLVAVATCITGLPTFTSSAQAQDVAHHPLAAEAASDVPPGAPAGGVLAKSFDFHRQGYGGIQAPHHTITPPGGWYGYGFPVQTYRWGWFGAGRYYPHVVWHRGYYGDCCRWAYRHGY
jgi:hypothetical protein